MKVAVVILNYNGKKYLGEFLPSVVKYSEGHRVIVADNCSTDDSVDFVKNNFPSVELLCLPNNAGYSAGYNAALARVTNVDYHVLLNSDVEVTANWIAPVINSMVKHNAVAAQPKVLSYHQKTHFEYAGAAGGFIDTLGYPFCRGRIFFEVEKDNGQYNDDLQIFWATGACLFIKADVFDQLGGFDPDFFAHMEEIDLCWRINSTGNKIIYCGHSTVYHVGGGTLNKSNPHKTYLNFRNGFALLYKNYSIPELWLKLPIRLFLDIIAAVKFFLFDSAADGWAVIKAHIHFWRDITRNKSKRNATKPLNSKYTRNIIFQGSVVSEYFLKGKKHFTQLKFKP